MAMQQSKSDSVLIPPVPQVLQNLRDWLWVFGAAAALWIFYRSKGKGD